MPYLACSKAQDDWKQALHELVEGRWRAVKLLFVDRCCRLGVRTCNASRRLTAAHERLVTSSQNFWCSSSLFLSSNRGTTSGQASPIIHNVVACRNSQAATQAARSAPCSAMRAICTAARSMLLHDCHSSLAASCRCHQAMCAHSGSHLRQ